MNLRNYILIKIAELPFSNYIDSAKGAMSSAKDMLSQAKDTIVDSAAKLNVPEMPVTFLKSLGKDYRHAAAKATGRGNTIKRLLSQMNTDRIFYQSQLGIRDKFLAKANDAVKGTGQMMNLNNDMVNAYHKGGAPLLVGGTLLGSGLGSGLMGLTGYGLGKLGDKYLLKYYNKKLKAIQDDTTLDDATRQAKIKALGKPRNGALATTGSIWGTGLGLIGGGLLGAKLVHNKLLSPVVNELNSGTQKINGMIQPYL